MNNILPRLIVAVFFFSIRSYSQEQIQLSSPHDLCVFTFRIVDTIPQYSVSFKGKTLITSSSLRLSYLENAAFGNRLRMGKPTFAERDTTYDLIVGKARHVPDCFREVRIPLEERGGSLRRINIVARAYDDGVAFRYEYPRQDRWSSYILMDERSDFNINSDPTLRTLFLPGYTTSHEGGYTTIRLSEVREDTLMDMPTLFEFADGTFMAITEAALVDYAGMYLVKHNGRLTSQLSPLPDGGGQKVKATLPHQSPWRVVMIGDRIGTLIESNILTSLNAPCAIEDVSWIRPGKTTFPWWNGNITPDTTFAPGNNFETQKYYIDFCAAHSIQYHTVVEYGVREWYVNDGVNFMPGPHVDVMRPVPGLDMERVCSYGKSKGVGIRVWVHWKALYQKLDEALAQFEKWGISGMMVDFMDRDDQEMVNIQVEILRKAAAHKLHIQFHGAYKPTGLHRTYPNEFTREGTMNYEVNKSDKRVNPDHDINIPFTRMLAGSTDYHLGGFRAVPESAFKAQYTRPLMLGTRCHMLAMYVVLENYLGMVCDYPDAYINQPGFDFLEVVPTVWDETRVIDGRPGEWLSIARRRDSDWFVGTITNHRPRTVQLELGFLPEGTFNAEIYGDAADAAVNPNRISQHRTTVTRGDTIKADLAEGGGQVIRLWKERQK
ncbi:MAG TPA: glycoside hydrolase family 97 protein [Bacteroidota bacterium]|nr:glycoside hydrolase family 97 protein [Bacteroidota bacterium]